MSISFSQIFFIASNLLFAFAHPHASPIIIKSDSLKQCKQVGWSRAVSSVRTYFDCNVQVTDSLRGGFESDQSESRQQTETSIYAYLKGYGVTGSLSTLTVIYSADTGSVELGCAMYLFHRFDHLSRKESAHTPPNNSPPRRASAPGR